MDINTAKKALAGGCSVAVAAKSGAVYTETGHSVRPLYKIYAAHGADMDGAFVADKIIGKAAASILVAARAAGVFAYMMSESGLVYLLRHGVSASFETLVPFIENRDGTDMCPMEKTVDGCDEPEECVARIAAFIERVQYPAD